ncbi:MAG: hypothetical protein ACYDEA_01825 [Candidatus Dormibacteria bacterium]
MGERGRKEAYSSWSTADLEAALARFEARRSRCSRDDFGIIGHAGKIRYELDERAVGRRAEPPNGEGEHG